MFAMTTLNSESHDRAPQSVIIVRLILKINCLHSSVSDACYAMSYTNVSLFL